MRLGLRDIDWPQAGAQLANEGDKEQAEFFKSFIKEMNNWGTHFQVELQLAGVNKILTEEERETLEMLSFKDK